jgi:putative ABC transport system permease protein
MVFAIQTLWFERKRYWAGVFAVSFSVVLIAVQIGLMQGLMSMVSFPVDVSRADVWVTAPKVPSCDLGTPMNRDYISRVLAQPDVVAVDEYIQWFTYWKNPSGGTVLIIVAGCDLSESSQGPIRLLQPEERSLLTEVGAVIVNDNDMHRLGVKKIGDTATVGGVRVRVVGVLHNMGSLTGPYVMCSLRTARLLLHLDESKTVYLLARCRYPEQAKEIAADLSKSGKISAFTADDFSSLSRWYWINNTKAGVAIGFVALLGLGVGAVITSQTLYAATVASLRELMVLRALGVPRWRMTAFVLCEAFWVGVLGVLVGIPTTFGVGAIGGALGVQPIVDLRLIVFTSVVCLIASLVAGMIALRSLRGVEPSNLLR